MTNSDRVVDEVSARLVKFGNKRAAAQRWLKGFPPVNTPNGGELKRFVLCLPAGYRERRDIIAQYKDKGYTHENARFRMLSDHAGPANTLVYVQPTGGDGAARGHIGQQVAEQRIVERSTSEAAIRDTKRNENGSTSQGAAGPINFVSED